MTSSGSRRCAALLATLTALAPGQQQVPPTRPGQQPQLAFATGRVTVQGGIATIDLPVGWRYLHGDAARWMVEQKWGNRANPGTLGLILPAEDWGGFVVSFDGRGFVPDDDGDIDPQATLKAMRQNAAATAPARRRDNLPVIQSIEWAEEPRYDRATRTLTWGRYMQLEGSALRTFNYDARILAAPGALVLQAVANVGDAQRAIAAAHLVLGRIELAPGVRYEDHDPLRHKRSGTGVTNFIEASSRPAIGPARLLVKPVLVAGVLAGALWFRRRRANGGRATPD